jgi:uncharacterized protein
MPVIDADGRSRRKCRQCRRGHRRVRPLRASPARTARQGFLVPLLPNPAPGNVTAHLCAASLAALVPMLVAFAPSAAAATGVAADGVAWWVWPVALFFVCFALGIVAIPAGVGGGVLFVPIVGGFFPFHIDFVRGAGLLVALASALAAGPSLLRSGLADLRLALPLALLASASSIAGAMIGLAMPPSNVQVALGVTILGIVGLMVAAGKSELPEVATPDRLSAALAIHGVFRDAASGHAVAWQVHRTPGGLALFTGIGMLAGMFGMGAGWANVPVLNLLMGAPLKVSAGTSSFILSLVDSAAAWVYLNEGAVLAVVAVPSVIGMMIGARIGARLLNVMKAAVVRKLVLTLLLFSGARALLKGLAIWN